jgi:ribosome-binding factor A
MPKRSAAYRGPSQRQLRVGELVRQALSDLILRGDIPDPDLESRMITVSEVRMSPDLKIATAYITPLGGQEDPAPIVKALARNGNQIRAHVARNVNLKFAPEIRFRADERFEEDLRIDRLLQSEEVARDLRPKYNEE